MALLAANETGTFYMQLKQGAQDAAENLDAALVVEIIGANGLGDEIVGLAEDGVTAAIVYCEDGVLTADALSALDAAGIASVTVLATDCMSADAWATALLVAGPAEGMALAQRMRLEALFIVRREERWVEMGLGRFAVAGAGS